MINAKTWQVDEVAHDRGDWAVGVYNFEKGDPVSICEAYGQSKNEAFANAKRIADALNAADAAKVTS